MQCAEPQKNFPTSAELETYSQRHHRQRSHKILFVCAHGGKKNSSERCHNTQLKCQNVTQIFENPISSAFYLERKWKKQRLRTHARTAPVSFFIRNKRESSVIGKMRILFVMKHPKLYQISVSSKSSKRNTLIVQGQSEHSERKGKKSSTRMVNFCH